MLLSNPSDRSFLLKGILQSIFFQKKKSLPQSLQASTTPLNLRNNTLHLMWF